MTMNDSRFSNHVIKIQAAKLLEMRDPMGVWGRYRCKVLLTTYAGLDLRKEDPSVQHFRKITPVPNFGDLWHPDSKSSLDK